MGGRTGKRRDAVARRSRVVAFCRSLPEVDVEAAGTRHLAFKVRRKTLGYYLDDHHGDGRIALCCKAPPGEQARLVGTSPKLYFVPPYVGNKGWVGLRIDLERVSWSAARNLLLGAYLMTAPATLRRRVEAGAGPG